jgi:hypothetical protein
MKASLSNDYRPTRVAQGKPLDLVPDDGSTVMSFSLLKASFVEQRWTT